MCDINIVAQLHKWVCLNNPTSTADATDRQTEREREPHDYKISLPP